MSVEEKLNQANGAIKEGVGKVTDDKKTEKEGAAEKGVSKVKEVAEMPKMLLKEQLKVLKILLKRTINNSKIGWFFT